MFQVEEQELQHSPDDECYGRLRISDLDESPATTPQRPFILMLA